MYNGTLGPLLKLLDSCLIRNEEFGKWRKICPNCHLPLPRKTANGEISSEVIAIIGARNSGKSNYFGVLIDFLKHRYSHEVGFMIFDQETWSINEEKPINSDRLYHNRYGRKLFGNEERVAIEQTRRVEITSENRIPLIYRLEFPKRPWHYVTRPFAPASALDLVFFDTAGEDLRDEEVIEESCRYILGASGIIFVIDPFRYPGVYSQLPQALRDRLPRVDARSAYADVEDHPSRLVHNVIRLYEKWVGVPAGGKINVPAAFALSKCDMLDGILDRSSLILKDSRHEGGFNLSDCTRLSHEVRERIREWDNQLCHQAEKFRSTCYFAFSSLGELPDENMRIGSVSPCRIADPLLWVLWRLGYIRTLPENQGENR